MSNRGRKPKSLTEKIIDGTASLAELPADVPPASVVCPDWLDDDGREEWARVIDALDARGILESTDTMLLASYCDTYSQWKKSVMQLRDEGPTFVDAKGDKKMNPLAKHATLLGQELRRIAAEFGFSPAARSRIKTPPGAGDEGDDLDGFLNEPAG